MLLKHLSPILAGLACASFASHSYAYDWETSLELSKNEENSNPATLASASYFFSSVNHSSSTPWEETVFTDRIAFLQFGVGYQKQSRTIDLQFEELSDVPSIKINTSLTSLSANYTHQSANSPHSFSVFLSNNRISSDSLSLTSWNGYPPIYGEFDPSDFEYVVTTTSSDALAYGIDYSYYLQDNWSIGIAAGGTDSDGPNTYSVGVHTNRLWSLGNNQWVGLKAAINRNDADGYSGENWLYEIEGRYYFDERTGISLGIEIPDGGIAETYSLGFHRYLTQQLSLDLGYDYTKLDVPTYIVQPNGSTLDDTNSNVRLRLSYRF